MTSANVPARDAGPAVLLAAVLGSSMVFLDGTTVNVALPALQASLGASVVDVQWVINGYTLFLAALLMLGGSLGDHLGRKRMFMVGMIVFTLASIWCGLAGDVQQLIAARALQGVGGALLTPGSLALINANFSEGARGSAIGRWSAYSAIAVAGGPILGGWLIDTFSWRWIFFINLPIALAALLLTARRVPESRDPDADAQLDYLGAALVTLGLGGAVYALLEAPARSWGDPLIIAAGLGGTALLLAFVFAEARSSSPMVPLGLFRSRVFSGINLVTLLLYANLAGLSFFLPMYLIQVRGFSAAAAGAAGLPLVILLFLASSWSGRLYDRVGPRAPIAGGALLTALAFVLFVVLGGAPNFLISVTLPMTVMGAGMALLVAPLTTTVMAAVPETLAGTASGINNAVSRVAGLLAIGLLGVVMLSAFGKQLTLHLAHTDLPVSAQATLLASRNDLAGMALPESLTQVQGGVARAAIDESFTYGFRLALLGMGGVAVLGALVALATLPTRTHSATAP